MTRRTFLLDKCVLLVVNIGWQLVDVVTVIKAEVVLVEMAVVVVVGGPPRSSASPLIGQPAHCCYAAT